MDEQHPPEQADAAAITPAAHLSLEQRAQNADSSKEGQRGPYLVLAAVILLLSAAGSYIYIQRVSSNSPGIAELEVTVDDIFYGSENNNLESPPVWQVQRNAPVQVRVINRGELNHNWAIVHKDVVLPVPFTEGQSSDKILFTAGMVYGDNQTTLTFFAPDVGEYQVICTVEGHYPFMQGRLIVE